MRTVTACMCALCTFSVFSGCNELSDQSSPRLSDSTVVAGLKQALKVGTDTAVSQLNQTDGYLGDAAVRILLPEDVRLATQYVDDELLSNPAVRLAAGTVIEDFKGLTGELETQINRAAEDAAGTAGPIFFDAVTGITIADGRSILFAGKDSAAATTYLRRETFSPLFDAYRPRVDSVLGVLNVNTLYTNLTTTYNQVKRAAQPFGLAEDAPNIETDLATYTTNKGLEGLFFKVEIEERAIRQDPVARVDDLLQEVFGELD